MITKKIWDRLCELKNYERAISAEIKGVLPFSAWDALSVLEAQKDHLIVNNIRNRILELQNQILSCESPGSFCDPRGRRRYCEEVIQELERLLHDDQTGVRTHIV